MSSPQKFLILFILLTGAIKGWADDVPVAPISSTQIPDWGEVYEITSRRVTLIVSPSAGAVVSLRHSGKEELLTAPMICKAMGNPPEEIPWESRAWRSSEGKQVVMLHRNLPPPYHLRIVHVIELSASGDHFRQTTRFTGLGPGALSSLEPSFSAELLLPDGQKQNETGSLQLTYGSTLSEWGFLWEIEQPEFMLDKALVLRKSEDRLSISSRPKVELELPPQGWTLLCSLEIFWSQIPPSPR